MPSEVSMSGADQVRRRTSEELEQELAEAREQQVATAEILRVISSSPMDLHRVFAAIAASAARLCDAYDSVIRQVDGELLRLVAHHGPIPVDSTWPLTRGIVVGRAVLERRTIHVADLQAELDEYPEGRRVGIRAILVVPLIREQEAIGAITIRRMEVRPFTDRQIDLLQTFADQAVIAIENTRLLEAEQTSKRELQESLEYQSATSDVLAAISRTPTELQPVLDEICKTASRLCDTTDAGILFQDGDWLRLGAVQGSIGADMDKIALTRAFVTGRALLDREVVHVHDLRAVSDEFPEGYESSLRLGHRTTIAVPLLRKEEAIGVLCLRRSEVRPFNDRQIALLRGFADQAVIAIENTRLFEAEQASKRELQETLEYQTATSEVLGVISRSPTELQPVLDTIARTSQRLCEADRSSVWRLVDRAFELAAICDHSPAVADYMARAPVPADRTSAAGRCVLEKRTLHIHDRLNEPGLPPLPQSYASGARTLLCVPLLREGEPIGVVRLSRDKVAPFTTRQIALVETFADQAVIAIENTRLFEEVQARSRELGEALEQQTATSQVLSVISRSPGELDPVFQAMLENAVRICEAKFGVLFEYDEGKFRANAWVGVPAMYEEYLRQRGSFQPEKGAPLERLLRTKILVHAADELAENSPSPAAKFGSARSLIAAPMFKEDELVGAIVIYRTEVRPFTDKQIELVRDFAAQAVIAIENTRLLSELRESLQQQTATADVLKVISRSTFDLQVVLDALVESVARLCDADSASIHRPKADGYQCVASHGYSHEFQQYLRDHPIQPGRGSVLGRVVSEGKAVHVPDVLADPEHALVEQRKVGGYRTVLGVPLMRQGVAVGLIRLTRNKVQPFGDKQIELVTTFADQAVIAIENTRLFEEVQARTRDLSDTLEQQTATSEILSVISRSPTNIQPVFEAIADSAMRLCNADYGSTNVLEGGMVHLVAQRGQSALWLEEARRLFPRPLTRELIGGAAMLDREVVHLEDLQSHPEFPASHALARTMGYHTALAIPILRNEVPVGSIVMFRQEHRSFTDAEIGLLRTFADQAVIAIENTRLFEEVQARNTELRVALEQQTATSELLKVIGHSTFELQPVFDTLAENAVRLCSAERAFVHRFDGQFLSVVATYNVSPELRAFIESNPMAPGRYGVAARAALERRTVVIGDVQADPEITFAARDIEPVRTALSVPMLRSDELLGVIMIYRHEVNPFTDSQVALIETFADQAVIAIENARLLEELQARNRDLTALGEVGRAVSSTLDLKVVLKTIVVRAIELSSTDAGSIFYYRPETGRFELGETVGLDEETVARFRKLDIAAGQTGMGEVIAKREPLPIPDVVQRPSNALRNAALEAGLNAALIVPLLSSEGALGALVLQRRRKGKFPRTVVSLMQSFADQSVIALENARLFEEIAKKSRELEIASQHKSQFVANMSHELRTPLAAILGYAELIQEGLYGPLPEKSLDALTRIRSNGKHLLGLINTVLDIAKIESGQFTLNMAEYAIESVVETVRSATESLAQNKKLTLTTSVDKSLPVGLGDEQRLTQVLLNLVGNAIKFTDAGEVSIAAGARNGHFAVSVTDTGPGIPLDQQDRIFEQFHQVDSSMTKAKGGTGLGLAIAKQIVEMHGGRIWVESTLGKGSTFRMELPTRIEVRTCAP
jgi:GAF domain-containing protein